MSYLQSELSGMKLRNYLSGVSFSTFSPYWERLAAPVTIFPDVHEPRYLLREDYRV